jgi:hypothetical protein
MIVEALSWGEGEHMAPEDKPAIQLPMQVPAIGAASLARSHQPPAVFKITSTAAAPILRSLMRRAHLLELTSVFLILAAFGAIAGGIYLIYRAGDLSIQQRSSDVDVLLNQDEGLRWEREQAQKTLDSLELGVSYYQKEVDAFEDREKALPAVGLTKDQLASKTINAEQLRRASVALDDKKAELDKSKPALVARLAELDKQRKEISQQIASSGTAIKYNALLIRAAAVLLIIFLVQTFISIFRYTMRLAAYYQARADALKLAAGTDLAISDFQKMTAVLSPETYDFGRSPRTPVQQAVELAKELLRSQTKRE